MALSQLRQTLFWKKVSAEQFGHVNARTGKAFRGREEVMVRQRLDGLTRYA
jgi:hypothetical protein